MQPHVLHMQPRICNNKHTRCCMHVVLTIWPTKTTADTDIGKQVPTACSHKLMSPGHTATSSGPFRVSLQTIGYRDEETTVLELSFQGSNCSRNLPLLYWALNRSTNKAHGRHISIRNIPAKHCDPAWFGCVTAATCMILSWLFGPFLWVLVLADEQQRKRKPVITGCVSCYGS